MQSYRIACVALFAVMSWPISWAWTQSLEEKRLTLLSPQEAEQLQLTDEEWQQPTPRTRALNLGPHIVIENPSVRETNGGRTLEAVTPLDLSVRFEENRSPVNMSSLQVTARKGIFSKSLTALLLPYVQGATLQVSGAEIPQGKFQLEVVVADQNGAKTVETYRLEVKGR